MELFWCQAGARLVQQPLPKQARPLATEGAVSAVERRAYALEGGTEEDGLAPDAAASLSQDTTTKLWESAFGWAFGAEDSEGGQAS